MARSMLGGRFIAVADVHAIRFQENPQGVKGKRS
jgi:hypothetical protein